MVPTTSDWCRGGAVQVTETKCLINRGRDNAIRGLLHARRLLFVCCLFILLILLFILKCLLLIYVFLSHLYTFSVWRLSSFLSFFLVLGSSSRVFNRILLLNIWLGIWKVSVTYKSILETDYFHLLKRPFICKCFASNGGKIRNALGCSISYHHPLCRISSNCGY